MLIPCRLQLRNEEGQEVGLLWIFIPHLLQPIINKRALLILYTKPMKSLMILILILQLLPIPIRKTKTVAQIIHLLVLSIKPKIAFGVDLWIVLVYLALIITVKHNFVTY